MNRRDMSGMLTSKLMELFHDVPIWDGCPYRNPPRCHSIRPTACESCYLIVGTRKWSSVADNSVTNYIAALQASEQDIALVRAASGIKNPAHLMIGITCDQTCLVLKNRLRMLRITGFNVTLVSSPGWRLQDTAKAEGVSAQSIPMMRGIAPIADTVSFFKLLWLMLRHRPQITDFSTPKAGLLGTVAAWVLRIPHRVYTLRGLRLEATFGWKRTVLVWAERTACRCAHVVLCNSESLGQKAVLLRLTSPEKLQILGNGSSNGVDISRFSPGLSDIRRQLNIRRGEPVIGFVGRLTRDKGLTELIIAFERILQVHPNAWLLLVGWFDVSVDALDETWRVRIAANRHVHHIGFVEDPAPYYRAMDLLVLPSYREGFPNVVLEAAATGIPTIATECTGSRDAVISEVTGLLIPPGNSDAIVDATLELLRDEQKRKRMGKAARRWVLDFYDQKRVLALAASFYHSLLKQ